MPQRILFAAFMWLLSSIVTAQGIKAPKYTQLLAGQLQLSSDIVTLEYDNTHYLGELDTLPYFGGGAQIILQSGRFGYGWETGGFISWKNDNFAYSAQSGPGGATLTVDFDNEFWAFETFMGMYAEIKPLESIRLYLGAGPLILFGWADRDDRNEHPSTPETLGSIIVIEGNNSDTDISAGYYVRFGTEMRVYKNFWAGLNVRYMDAELDLSQSLGHFKIDGSLFLLSISRQFR